MTFGLFPPELEDRRCTPGVVHADGIFSLADRLGMVVRPADWFLPLK
jgi:hypothetical protein